MTITLLTGDCRDLLPTLPADSVHCVITSPPYYGLRDYQTGTWDGGDAACDHAVKQPKRGKAEYTNGQGGSFASNLQAWGDRDVSAVYRNVCGKCGARRIDRQIGLEPTPDAWLATMVQVFREIRRVMRPDATAWINMGDGFRDKQLLLMPARLALALQQDGWWIRSDIIVAKKNPMPESVRDRPVNAYEHFFLLTKSARYFFDMAAIAEPAGGANSATLGGAALAPKANAALDADNRAPYLHGRCDLGQPQITIDGAVTWDAKHAEIVERIRFSVIIEQAERSFVVDLQPSNGVASLAAVASTLKRCASDNLPIRATIVDPSAAECWAGDADPMGAVPLSDAALGAETVLQSGELLADMIAEGHTAEITLHCDELSAPLLVLGTCRPAHRLHDTTNTPTRNARNVWDISTEAFRGAHFAVMPSSIVEKAIRAGTSERGCCAACGKPWVRVTERRDTGRTQKMADGWDTGVGGHGTVHRDGREAGMAGVPVMAVATTGWSPGCKCDAGDPVPATVLDPFVGSGTTALVADRLQRHAIGIDLSLTYASMAQRRIEMDAGMFAELAPVPEPPEDERMADLFAGDEYQQPPAAVPVRDAFRNSQRYVNQGPQPSNGAAEAAE